jgi:hypothetical protein
VNSKEVGIGDGELGVAEVRGVSDASGEGIEKGESGFKLVDADVDEREVEVCPGESRMEIGIVGMMREGRRGRLWKLCAGLDSSLIFLPRSIITIG